MLSNMQFRCAVSYAEIGKLSVILPIVADTSGANSLKGSPWSRTPLLKLQMSNLQRCGDGLGFWL